MTSRAPTVLGVATTVLSLAAAAVVTTAGHADSERAARGVAFQHLVGGLGLGPSTDLAGCERSFDARIGGTCGGQLDDAPGGVVPCGHGGAGSDR